VTEAQGKREIEVEPEADGARVVGHGSGRCGHAAGHRLGERGAGRESDCP
jgi:hypothetical protein